MSEFTHEKCSCFSPDPHPIFSLLENSDSSLQNCSGKLELSANEQVLSQGEHVKGVYTILSGKVKVHALGESGKDQIIRFSKRGDVLGFRTLLSDQSLGVSATTLEPTTLCLIDKESFKEMMKNETFRNRVLLELAKDLSHMVGALTGMAQKSVRSRLCSALILLQDLYGDDPINLSREDLANYVGTASESVIRMLSEMKNDALLEIKGRKIKVIDVQALEKMSLYS